MAGMLSLSQLILKKAEELISGGKADGMGIPQLARRHDVPDKSIQGQVKKGLSVESEHTDDPATAREISEDHLEEFPDYYDRLGKMEEEAKAEKNLGEEASPEDIGKLLDTIRSSEDLDDDKMHELYMSLGLKPDEAEELVYSALQQYLRKYPNALDPNKIEEKETDGDESEEGRSESGLTA